MKRDLALRNLRMGCGEGLVGRVRRFTAGSIAVPSVHRPETIERQAGKDKR